MELNTHDKWRYTLTGLMIYIEFDKISTTGVVQSTSPSLPLKIPVGSVLQDAYEKTDAELLRGAHLSWEKFKGSLQKVGFEVGNGNYELGWIQPRFCEGTKDEYLPINTEKVFRNAVNVLWTLVNQNKETPAITLHLRKPNHQGTQMQHQKLEGTKLLPLGDKRSIGQYKDGQEQKVSGRTKDGLAQYTNNPQAAWHAKDTREVMKAKLPDIVSISSESEESEYENESPKVEQPTQELSDITLGGNERVAFDPSAIADSIEYMEYDKKEPREEDFETSDDWNDARREWMEKQRDADRAR